MYGSSRRGRRARWCSFSSSTMTARGTYFRAEANVLRWARAGHPTDLLSVRNNALKSSGPAEFDADVERRSARLSSGGVLTNYPHFTAFDRETGNVAKPMWWSVEITAEPPLGAHLVTPRRGYSHHGIYVGDNKVVHYAGLSGSMRGYAVQELSIVDFSAGHGVVVKQERRAEYVGQDAIRRARSRLGENRYRLLTNNCEHFCSWCLFGESHSEQVRQCIAHPYRVIRTAIMLLKALLESGSKVRPRFVPDSLR